MTTRSLILTQFIIFSFLILSSGQNLYAEEIKELKEIKVASSRNTLTAENLPGSLTIFTEQEINQKQHQTVEDLLRGELGLDVVQSGPQGNQTSIFMRGQGSKSTQVVIDGIRINSNTAGLFDFGDLTLDNIERIEVLRGPQSLQWGADAVGGTINITTKKGKGTPKHSLSFEGGSYKTFKQSIRSSGAINKFDYSLSTSLLKTSGFSALNERSGGSEEDGHINKTFSSRVGYDFSQDTRWELSTRYTKSHDELDDVWGQENSGNKDNGNSTTIDDFYLSTLFKTKFFDWWQFKVNPNMYFQEAFTIATAENDYFINRQYTFYLENNMKLGRHLSFLWGGEYERQEGDSDGNFGGTGYKEFTDNKAFFIQSTYDYKNIMVVTAGLRHDINSRFDKVDTYKIEAGHNFLKTNTKLHAAFATGFRAPTFNDYKLTPELLSERTKSFEIGVKQSLMDEKIRLGVTFFNSITHNFIQAHSVSPWTTENFGKFHSQGIETELDLKLPHNFSLSMRHTWNDHYLNEKTKPTNHQPGNRRPKHKVNANLTHNWNNKLDSLVGIFARGSAKGWSAINETKGYVTVRSAFTYKYNKNIKITLRGENLLNKDYVEVGGFSTAGINGYGGFVYTFN